MKKMGLTLLLILLGLVAYIKYVEISTVFVPAKTILTNPSKILLPYEDVYFHSGRDRLHGWMIPAPPESGSSLTVLFLHGNAGNIGDRLDKIAMFHQLGAAVFVFDYRGYGISEGRPSEKGLYEDAAAAFDYLAGRPDADPERIVVYGESLGGAAGVDLALRRPLRALIIDSTFTNAADMARRILPWAPTFLISAKFDSLAKIQKVRVPVLVVHSRDDEMVPFEMGQRMFAAAPEPKTWLEVTGTHNDAYLFARKIFMSGIGAFLEKNR